MPKQKATGLSKKVPAIFEGLPNLEPPASKDHFSFGGAFGPLMAHATRGTVRFLFEAGEFSVKAIIEKKSPGGWHLIKCKKYFFEADAQGRRAQNFPALTEWLKELVREYAAFGNLGARLLFTGHGVFVTEFEKPQVPLKEIREAVIWQLAEKLPFPVEESKVLYEIVGEKVSAAALHQPVLESLLEPFHEAEIYPELVTLLPMAYESLNRHQALFASKNVLLLHTGSEQTAMLTFQSGGFHSMREIAFGGDPITQAMMGTFILENQQVVIRFSEAEAIKENLGMPTPNLTADPREPKLSQLSARVRPVFEKAVNEIRSTILQFQRQLPNEKIDAIYLSGEGAEMKGMDVYFSSQLNLPVLGIEAEKIEAKLDFAFAGLMGLRYAGPAKFNFSLPADLWKPRLERCRGFLQIGSVVMAGLFAVVFVTTAFQIISGKFELGRQNKKLLALGPNLQKIEELDAVMKEIEMRRSLLSKNIGTSPHWGAVLRELTHLVPGPMVLKSMSMAVKNVPVMDFEGTIEAKAGSKPGDLVVSEFLDELNRSPFFTNSTLESRSATGDAPKSGIQFSIRTRLVVPFES